MLPVNHIKIMKILQATQNLSCVCRNLRVP